MHLWSLLANRTPSACRQRASTSCAKSRFFVRLSGCKIKALRAKTNTYIKTPVRGEEPVFVVTGRREDVCAAKREILSAADHFSQIRASRRNNSVSSSGSGGSMAPGPPSPSTPGQVTIQVRVPYRVVGLVVGPKGATIKRIQQQTHTYIVTPSRDKEPIFEVTGLPDNVEKARQEIESHIAMRTGGLVDGGNVNSVTNGTSQHDHNDFLSNGIDSCCREISPADLIGSMYKPPSINSAFTCYNGVLENNINLNLNRMTNVHGADIFTFPLVNGTEKMGIDMTNSGYTLPSAFGLYDSSDEGIASPPYETLTPTIPASSIWSDLGGSDAPRMSSLFTPITINNLPPRRSNSTVAPLSSSMSPINGGVAPEHSAVRRIRSDPLTTPFGTGQSAFTPPTDNYYVDGDVGVHLVSFATLPTSQQQRPSSSLSSSPTDSTGSLDQRRSCYVCTEHPIVAALVPCGHNLFCMDCANVLMSRPDADRQCPVCRQTPTQAIRIFS